MEERLRYIFEIVNDWLKFAEAKNAALLVANFALIAAAAGQFPSKEEICARYLALVGSAALSISSLLALGSFLPRLTFRWSNAKAKPSAQDNFYYFGHIAKYSPFDFYTALYGSEALSPRNSKLEIDLTAQIVINAKIALHKFQLFTAGAWFAIAGIVAFILAGISLFL